MTSVSTTLNSVLLCVTFIIYPVFTKTVQFPSSFPRCSKSDSSLDECLKDAIQVSIKIVAQNGIPEVGLPPLDPYLIPEIILETQGETVKVAQKYYDIKFYGVSDTIITSAHVDLDEKILSFSTYTPAFKQVSSYTFEGKILILPIYGNGSAELTAYNSTLNHTITFKETVSNSKTFFNIASYVINWKATGVNFGLENLFNGNKELSDNMLNVLNENWEAVWEDVKNGFEIAYGDVLRYIANKFFSSVPMDQIFL